jgi:GTP-binding protein
MLNGVVAVIGRPNVGKSTIFNRMIGERKSIVEDYPGVTRDRLYGTCEWLTRKFRVIDTGGIELENRPFQEQIRMQAEIAMNEADVIVLICDGRTGVTSDDKFIASILYKFNKPIIVGVNKIDDGHLLNNIYEFYTLGLGDPIAISGLHGVGMGDLLDKVIQSLPQVEETVNENAKIKFSFIGRPNVGKSSLVNAVLNQERVIVSDIEGTTRDAIDTDFERDGKQYSVIDTAGLKKRGQIYEAIDKYSALRALSAIDRSDVVLLVIDASVGIRIQDKNVASYALEAGKAMAIVVNKWDTVEKETNTMAEYTKKIRHEFQFLDYAPVVYVSALHKQRIATLFEAINVCYESATKRVQTSVLNDILLDAQQRSPAFEFNGGVIKIYYASQVSVNPPTIILFVNNPEYMHFSYRRYLENRIREAFGFEGTPIHFILRVKQ